MMQSFVQKFRQRQIGRVWYFALLLLLIVARLAIPFCQRVFLMAGGSALDDSLMLQAAGSVAAGQWLGPYTAISMAKSMGFALWLAFLHKAGLPYLVVNAVLWLAVCAFAARALRPLATGNLARLCLFGFFAFLPTSFAQFTLRAYRDSVFPAFCLLLFAGVLGLALRAGEKAPFGRWLAALGAGLGLTGVYLLREDGMVLLPFAVCGLALVLLYALFGKAVRQKVVLCLQCLLPGLLLGLGLLGFGFINYQWYGVFMVNDLTAGAFPRAYGAIAAVGEGEGGYKQGAPVPNEALEKLYAEVPSLGALRGSLESGPAYNGYYDKERNAFGGSFYYALRMAAWYEGKTPDAVSAQGYWGQVQAEVEAAVTEGRLKSAKPQNSTIPRWNKALFSPLLKESLSALKMTLLFEEIEPRPQLSEGAAGEVQKMADWLHAKTQPDAYEEGSGTLYLNPLQKAVFLFADAIVWLYRILLWPLLIAALVQTGQGLWFGTGRLLRQKRYTPGLLAALLALGLLLSYLLRIGVASYMEVAAFGVGTYLMYLAGGVPALALFCAFGALQTPGEKGAVPCQNC